MSNDVNDILSGLGLTKGNRGRQKGSVSKHTTNMMDAIGTLAKKSKGSKSSAAFILPADSITVEKTGQPCGYDQRRALALKFCEANAGWSVAPKAYDADGAAQVVLTYSK